MKVAIFGGALCVAMSATSLRAQIVNPGWELPADANKVGGNTDTVAQLDGNNVAGATDGWYLSQPVNPVAWTGPGNPGNPNQTDPWFNTTTSGVTANGNSFWMQTFLQSGYASQPVIATDASQLITPGTTYTFKSQMAFQDGTGPGRGYNAVTLANQTPGVYPTDDTGNLNTYLRLQFMDVRGIVINTYETDIPAGSINIYDTGGDGSATLFEPYSVSGLAPTGAASALLTIGWNNGGLGDNGTGPQSAFADDATFTVASVPEPASLSLLAIGGIALLVRRRATSSI
jgi:hypothetical protein